MVIDYNNSFVGNKMKRHDFEPEKEIHSLLDFFAWPLLLVGVGLFLAIGSIIFGALMR
jgi:hypothetical protein